MTVHLLWLISSLVIVEVEIFIILKSGWDGFSIRMDPCCFVEEDTCPTCNIMERKVM